MTLTGTADTQACADALIADAPQVGLTLTADQAYFFAQAAANSYANMNITEPLNPESVGIPTYIPLEDLSGQDVLERLRQAGGSQVGGGG